MIDFSFMSEAEYSIFYQNLKGHLIRSVLDQLMRGEHVMITKGPSGIIGSTIK